MLRPSSTAVHQSVPSLFRPLLHHLGHSSDPAPEHSHCRTYRSIRHLSGIQAPSSTSNTSHPFSPGPPGRGPRRAC